jgi:methyl-accepting chemotaxis protein
LTGANNPYPDKLAEYECGFPAFEDPRSQFDVRFYLVAILFIVFDLEAAFLFPWGVSLSEIGVVGWVSMMGLADRVTATMAEAQLDAKQASDFSNVVTPEIQAANTYLSDQDAKSDAEFRRLGWEAHRLHRTFATRQDAVADQIARTVAIDTTLARVEAAFALSHRLTDLGRLDDAHEEAQRARKMVPGLLEQLTALEHLRAQQLAAMSASLRGQSVRHAVQLSHGDLQQRTDGEMPGEFKTLADAMNHATIALSRIASGAAKTADEVAQSASDIASASKQISASAGEVADAVEEVSHGAESQVAQLRQVNEALDGIRTRGITSSDVPTLARLS